MGRWAEVDFALAAPGGPPRGAAGGAPLGFRIEVDVFRVPPVLAGQDVLTTLNGWRVHSAFVGGRTTLAFAVPAERLSWGAGGGGAPNRLTFDLPDAIRPMEFGMDDSRMLGLKLFSIAVEAAPDDGDEAR